MKTSFFFIAVLLIATTAFSQNTLSKVYTKVEVVAPQFKTEVFESVNDFLKNAVEYPQQSKNMGMQGTEVVEFMVTADGKIKDFKVENSISSEIDNEVIRVLLITDGKWTPGMVNGKPIDMRKDVSVTFISTSEQEMVKKAKDLQERGNYWMFEKNKPGKAVKYFDESIRLLPFEESLLAARSLCKYELGDKEGALADWNRINNLSDKNMLDSNLELADNYFNLKGYNEMRSTIHK